MPMGRIQFHKIFILRALPTLWIFSLDGCWRAVTVLEGFHAIGSCHGLMISIPECHQENLADGFVSRGSLTIFWYYGCTLQRKTANFYENFVSRRPEMELKYLDPCQQNFIVLVKFLRRARSSVHRLESAQTRYHVPMKTLLLVHSAAIFWVPYA